MEVEKDRWGYFWKDVNVRQRVQQQVKAAGLAFYRSTTHGIYFSRQMAFEEVEDGVLVLVKLGKGFPISPPQLHFATSFSKPSLKDYRDMLIQLIGESWHWELSLDQVLKKVPRLIRKITETRGQNVAMQRLGQFHADKIYDYAILKDLSQHNPFICFENTEEQVAMFIVSVTATHVLFFLPLAQPHFNEENRLIIPRETELSAMRMIFAAELHSLSQVSHMRSNKNEYTLQFNAFYLRKMEYTRRVWRKTFNITRSAQFFECLVKEASHFGLHITVDAAGVKGNSAEDGLLSEAARREQKLKHYFNKDTLMELIDAYQKLVEYYSAEGPPYQEIYVHKTSALYNRADVQLIIKAHSLN